MKPSIIQAHIDYAEKMKLMDKREQLPSERLKAGAKDILKGIKSDAAERGLVIMRDV